jgi:TatD DNase family protein
MIVDSHCHLEYFSEVEVDEIIKQCSIDSISLLQNICVEIGKFNDIIKYSHKYNNIFCSIGTHPCHVESDGVWATADIISLHNQYANKIIGIGETGLDYYHSQDKAIIMRQKQAFANHIDVSIALNKPIIVHTRDAQNDTADILASYGGNIKGLIHCFTGSLDFMQKMLDIGFYISMSGIITFKNAENLRQAIRYLPLDRLIIETDSPYLAPIPLRGTQNKPQNVWHVAKYLADFYQTPFADFCSVTTANFHKLFTVKQ